MKPFETKYFQLLFCIFLFANKFVVAQNDSTPNPCGHLIENNAEENNIQHYPRTDSLPVNTLIINSFDAMSMKARKNKKELFRELADSLKQVLYESTPPPNGGMLIVVPELYFTQYKNVQCFYQKIGS